MSNMQYKYFYKTIKNLLKEYKKDEILFRANSSLGHPNKEIESITDYNTNEIHNDKFSRYSGSKFSAA